MELKNYIEYFIGLSKEFRDKELEIIRNGYHSQKQNTLKSNYGIENKMYWDKQKIENKIKSFLDEYKYKFEDNNVKFVACLMIHAIDSIHLLLENDVNLSVDKYRLPLEEILCGKDLNQTIYDRKMEKSKDDLYMTLIELGVCEFKAPNFLEMLNKENKA